MGLEIPRLAVGQSVAEFSTILPGELNLYRFNLHRDPRFNAPLEHGIPAGTAPIVTIPGLYETDRHMRDLRTFAHRTGHFTHRSHIGRNVLSIHHDMDTIYRGISETAEAFNRKVILEAHSMGGIYARYAANHMPDHVEQVTTIASPHPDRFLLGVDPKLWGIKAAQLAMIPGYFSMVNELHDEGTKVPVVNLLAKRDNIVKVEPEHRSGEKYIEINSSHGGILWNINTMLTLADVHADLQPNGTSSPSSYVVAA